MAGGFVEVNSDKVSVLTDVAENAAEIDIDAAQGGTRRGRKSTCRRSDGFGR